MKKKLTGDLKMDLCMSLDEQAAINKTIKRTEMQRIRSITGHASMDTISNIYIKIPHDELLESFSQIQNRVDTKKLP